MSRPKLDPQQAHIVELRYFGGNVARTLSGLHGDSLRGLDFTLKKSFPIKERLHLQFRAEVFNITNTPQIPGARADAPEVGKESRFSPGAVMGGRLFN